MMTYQRKLTKHFSNEVENTFRRAFVEILEEMGGPQKLHDDLGISPSQISRYVHGQIPAIPTLFSIAKWANVTVDWLLTMSGSKRAESYSIDQNANTSIEVIVYKNAWINDGHVFGEKAGSLFFSMSEVRSFCGDASSLVAFEVDERMHDDPCLIGETIVVQMSKSGCIDESGFHIIDLQNVPTIRIINKFKDSLIIKSNTKKIRLELTSSQMKYLCPVKSFGRIVWNSRNLSKIKP
jgi:transcriptional regulator with XRE-family HTH domain